MRGLLKDTVLEMLDRKTIWMLGIYTAIAILITIGSGAVNTSVNIQMEGNMSMNDINRELGDPIMQVFSWYITFLIFLVVVATAGILPNMFIKGRADFYTSKPLSRSHLFLLKFLNIFLVYGVLFIICGMLEYMAIYLVHGIFSLSVLKLLLLNLVSLFIWLSITAFGGIVFGSSVMAMMSAFIIWVIQRLLSLHEEAAALIDSKIVSTIITYLYYIFPKTGQVSDLTFDLTMGRPIQTMMPLYTSIIFSVLLLGITTYLFSKKNY